MLGGTLLEFLALAVGLRRVDPDGCGRALKSNFGSTRGEQATPPLLSALFLAVQRLPVWS